MVRLVLVGEPHQLVMARAWTGAHGRISSNYTLLLDNRRGHSPTRNPSGHHVDLQSKVENDFEDEVGDNDLRVPQRIASLNTVFQDPVFNRDLFLE